MDDLQNWVINQDPIDTEVLERATAATGAVVMGRRLFDIIDGPDGWNRDMGYGAQVAGTPPFFVVTHAAPDHVRLAVELGLRFTFVADLADAIAQAQMAAAEDGHGCVVIMGGASEKFGPPAMPCISSTVASLPPASSTNPTAGSVSSLV